MTFTLKFIAAIGMVLISVTVAAAASSDRKRDEVYSSSMKQCIPKSLMCANDEVFSSSLSQCLLKAETAAQHDAPVRLRTQFTGQTKCLDIVNDGQNNKPTMAACGNFTGQMWTLRPSGNSRSLHNADRVHRAGQVPRHRQ